MGQAVKKAFGALCLLAGLTLSAGSAAQSFTFAVMGDLGYSPAEEPLLQNVLDDIAKARQLAFVVHVGDLGRPSSGSCRNEFWARRLAQFQALPQPLVYTPGDNDWNDCGAPSAGGFNPLERLASLRLVFFPEGTSLGTQKLALERQSRNLAFAKYRENARWEQGGVVFATLNVAGSNNGFGRDADGDREFRERTAANLAWMSEAFARARAAGSRAIVLLQQANMWPEIPPFPFLPNVPPNGYEDLRKRLAEEAQRFGGPVLLVHGDSHYFRVDQPVRARGVAAGRATRNLDNVMRLEGFGSPNHHWVEVTVDPSDPQPFSFRPRIVPANVAR